MNNRFFISACMVLLLLSCSFANTEGPLLHVAAVQIQTRGSVIENTKAIVEKIAACAEQGVRVVVFEECVITGYDKEVINSATAEQLLRAEDDIAKACDVNNIYAVVGTPFDSNGVRYNTAVVFNPDGKIIERYAKIQLVGGDDWAAAGEVMSVFYIDRIPCSIIICHDERYPELVRLPVLAGARLVFYISSESDVKAESKLEPYRYQICARAVENNVYIVQANSPAMMSHGQSRIIRPDGNIIVEAGMFTEETISAVLEMNKATGGNAIRSLRNPALDDWWQAGMEKVVVRK